MMTDREKVWAMLLSKDGVNEMPEILVEAMKNQIFNVWSDEKIKSMLKSSTESEAGI